MAGSKKKRIYYPKRTPLFVSVEKIKLWPSRKGVLHGVKTFTISGGTHAIVVTHCGERIVINSSRNSHAARWLRNKWFREVCSQCDIPEWKLKKYSSTVFKNGRVFGKPISINPPEIS